MLSMRYAKTSFCALLTILCLENESSSLLLIYFMFSSLQDEYFEVDNLKTKHDGYFVNKGKLEQM